MTPESFSGPSPNRSPEKPYANPYDKHWDYREGLLDLGPRFFMRTRLMLGFFPPSPRRILDVGCGDGYFLALLAERGIRADGIDGSADAIERSKRRLGERAGDLRCCFIQEFKPDEPYDLLMCGEVLEHIEDDEGFLKEMHRIAAPDATLVLTVPVDMSLWSEADAAAGHFRRYTKDEIFGKLRRAGFEPEEHVIWGFPLTRWMSPRIRKQQTAMIRESAAGQGARKSFLKRHKTLLRPIKYVFLLDHLFNWTGRGVDIVVRARAK
ncbi:class I SAM-dependent methyltransferase [bacterium]|nr:class I SAM-dependent methyltransferase [bacterium]